MCGIAGAFGEQIGADPAVADGVRRMVSAQTHRGPDDEGELLARDAVLGHNRLSIIDLSPCGRQPMANESGTVWVIFNGEIYNHRQLRGELEARGHRFASSSDTEVLVHGYEEWGEEALLARLRGMFAFGVYDARGAEGGPGSGPDGRLVLARDRFGIKPLYYSAAYSAAPGGRRVVFASEVRALARSGLVPRDADPQARLGFLLFGSVPAPLTTLRGVRALPPGHYLTSDRRGTRVTPYYRIDPLFFAAEHADAAEAEPPPAYREHLGAVLGDTVAAHLISDAPLGVFLSGGIDSTALVALAAARRQELRTVGIVFDEQRYSEEPYQRVVAERFRTDHHSVRVTAREFGTVLEHFAAVMDQPTVDGVNTYFVARAARDLGLKAVLAGIGGDEVFAGYSTLRRARALSLLQRLPGALSAAVARTGWRRGALRRLAYLSRRGALPLYMAQRALYTPREAARLLGGDEREAWALLDSLEPAAVPRHPSLVQQWMETRHYLADQLLRDADVFGMAHSIEIRVPLLDHVLAEAVLPTPLSWRVDARWPKPLLSRTLGDVLPREVVFRRKQGFAFPIGAWLRSWDDAQSTDGDLDRQAVAETWTEFRKGRAHWSRPWTLFVLGRAAARAGAAWA